MIRLLLLVLLCIGTLNAAFYVVDGGQVVKIVNEPIGGADIIGTNGKLLKKYKTLNSAKRFSKRYKYKKKYTKKRKITKRKTYKKRKVSKKRYVSKKKTYKKKRRVKRKYISKKKRVVKKKYTSKKKRVAKKKYSKKKKVIKKKKKKDYIIIKTHERKLYHYLDDKLNKVYSIAVGKEESQHFGTYWVSKKKKWPDWIPTKNIKEEFPNLPNIVKGGKRNPLGARALYLGHSAYRIHGTNRPSSIGTAVSHGCFRMHNRDIITLYNRVRVGTKVYIR